MNKGEAICAWLDEHELYFKVAVLAKAIGSNPGNFAKYRAEKRIPNKYIESIELILYKYGYNGNNSILPINATVSDTKPIEAIEYKEVKKVAVLPKETVKQVITGKKAKPPRLPGENGYEYSIRIAEMGF